MTVEDEVTFWQRAKSQDNVLPNSTISWQKLSHACTKAACYCRRRERSRAPGGAGCDTVTWCGRMGATHEGLQWKRNASQQNRLSVQVKNCMCFVALRLLALITYLSLCLVPQGWMSERDPLRLDDESRGMRKLEVRDGGHTGMANCQECMQVSMAAKVSLFEGSCATQCVPASLEHSRGA